jgi:hypothetical protein
MAAKRSGVLAALAAMLAVLAAGAPPAGALSYYSARAWFNATIQGTYVSHGTEVDSSCDTPVTFTGDETLDFKSGRSVVLEADRSFDNSVGAGTLNRRTPITVTTTRSRTQSGPCRPEEDPPPVCGTKHVHFGMSLISRDHPLGLHYNFNDGRVIFPDDPFEFACRVPAVPWWGKLSSPKARLPAGKLFNRRVRRIVIHGHVGKTLHQPDAEGHYDLGYTITLLRRRGP